MSYTGALPTKAGTDFEPASKTAPPQDEPDQEFDNNQLSLVRNDSEQEPRPGSDVNVDYDLLLPEGLGELHRWWGRNIVLHLLHGHVNLRFSEYLDGDLVVSPWAWSARKLE